MGEFLTLQLAQLLERARLLHDDDQVVALNPFSVPLAANGDLRLPC